MILEAFLLMRNWDRNWSGRAGIPEQEFWLRTSLVKARNALHCFDSSFSVTSHMSTSAWRLCETDVTEIEQGTQTPHGWANWTDQLISFPGPLPSFSRKFFRKPSDQLLSGIRFFWPLFQGLGRILTVFSLPPILGAGGGYSLSALSPSVLGTWGGEVTHCLLSLWSSVLHKFEFFQIQELRIHKFGVAFDTF